MIWLISYPKPVFPPADPVARRCLVGPQDLELLFALPLKSKMDKLLLIWFLLLQNRVLSKMSFSELVGRWNEVLSARHCNVGTTTMMVSTWKSIYTICTQLMGTVSKMPKAWRHPKAKSKIISIVATPPGRASLTKLRESWAYTYGWENLEPAPMALSSSWNILFSLSCLKLLIIVSPWHLLSRAFPVDHDAPGRTSHPIPWASSASVHPSLGASTSAPSSPTYVEGSPADPRQKGDKHLSNLQHLANTPWILMAVS